MELRKVWILSTFIILVSVIYIVSIVSEQLKTSNIISYSPPNTPVSDGLKGKNWTFIRTKNNNKEDYHQQINESSNEENYEHVLKHNESESNKELGNYDHVFQEAEAQRNKLLASIAGKHPDKCMSTCNDRLDISKYPEFEFFRTEFIVNNSLFTALEEEHGPIIQCSGNIEIHYKSFGILHDALLRVLKWNTTGLIEAGKALHTFKSHALRTDDAEVLKPETGLLDVYCPGGKESFDNKTRDNVLMLKYLVTHQIKGKIDKVSDSDSLKSPFTSEQRFVIAIERGDYANFYHVMLHMHSMFTMLMAFHQQPVNTAVLILDAHPQAEVDEMLETLYGPLIRVTNLHKSVVFHNMVLSLKESESLLSKYWMPSLPYLEEFRTFVLNQHSIDGKHFLNCQKLTITFLWRRDKIWHPRNLHGSVQRKIFNEAEIFKAVYNKYPNFCVNSLLAESLPMKEQLKFISKTDILIGMHGAGLTHSLFLPKTSGLVELFPEKFRKMFSYHKLFEAIARWRNLPYIYWENTIPEHNMPHYYTRVDPVSFLETVDTMVDKLCQNEGRNY